MTSDEEEHNIFDNTEATMLGIDFINFERKHGQKLTLPFLFKLRSG
jgi:hypothetical protein